MDAIVAVGGPMWLYFQRNMEPYITKDSGQPHQKFDTGAVRDQREGKGRYDLLPPAAIRRLAQVYERGAKKYAERNWEKGMPLSRCLDSGIRHTFQYLEGHRDEDHLAQAVFNLVAVIEYEERIARGALPKELNDLPPPIHSPAYVPAANSTLA